MTTEDGLELHTESLLYRGDKQLAKSDVPVQFKRKDVSGTSTGMIYEAQEGRLELLADVTLRIQDEGNPPTDITADHALLVRPEGNMRFEGNVKLTRPGDVLTADRFEVDFGSDVSGCAFLAQIGDIGTGSGAAGLTRTQLSSTTNNAVVVSTFRINANGAPIADDFPFHLGVFC